MPCTSERERNLPK
uniref:Uncharacterized protein n=1 Tax=Anopheles arabiensis TaxID=7173 RepID=A0A182IHX5_ANOAR